MCGFVRPVTLVYTYDFQYECVMRLYYLSSVLGVGACVERWNVKVDICVRVVCV